MKKLIICFIILLCAAWLGLKIQADSGYVLISYGTSSIEITLWFAILVVLIGFMAFYILIRLVHNSKTLPKRVRASWDNYKKRRAIKITNIGLMQLACGSFKKSEKSLIAATKNAPNPFLNYTEAAYAAQRQSLYERRDDYLNKACQSLKKSNTAISIIRANMQVESHQWEKALETLKNTNPTKSNYKILLRLLQIVYENLCDWESMYNILPKIRKHGVLKGQSLIELEQFVYKELLKQAEIEGGIDYLQKAWNKMPRYLKRNNELIYWYVKELLKHNIEKPSWHIVSKALKKYPHNKLLEIYPQINSSKPIKQLNTAEKWLQSYPNNEKLIICIGKLCKKQELWGKACNYFEKSIKLCPNAESYLELGEIMEKQGNMKAAIDYYHKGLKLSDEGVK